MKLLLLLAPGLLLAQSNWTVPPEFASAGYRKEIVREGMVLSGPGPSGALTETFDDEVGEGVAFVFDEIIGSVEFGGGEVQQIGRRDYGHLNRLMLVIKRE
jgi:hypothetical protein